MCSDPQSVVLGPNSGIQEVQQLGHEEAQTFVQHKVSKKTAEEEPLKQSAVNYPTELCESQNHYSICGSQSNTAPVPSLSDNTVSMQVSQTQLTTRDITSKMRYRDEICDKHARKDDVLMEKWLICKLYL